MKLKTSSIGDILKPVSGQAPTQRIDCNINPVTNDILELNNFRIPFCQTASRVPLALLQPLLLAFHVRINHHEQLFVFRLDLVLEVLDQVFALKI